MAISRHWKRRHFCWREQKLNGHRLSSFELIFTLRIASIPYIRSCGPTWLHQVNMLPPSHHKMTAWAKLEYEMTIQLYSRNVVFTPFLHEKWWYHINQFMRTRSLFSSLLTSSDFAISCFLTRLFWQYHFVHYCGSVAAWRMGKQKMESFSSKLYQKRTRLPAD